MDFQLKDKTVLVTASSSGIGRAVAEAFVQESCNVAICARSKDQLIKTADEIKKSSGIEPLWCVCDINTTKDINATIDVVNKNFGHIDILVNNCGGPVAGIFENLNDEDWQSAFEQVLLSVVRFSRGILPMMKERRWGRIINITSVAVKQPLENLMLSNSLRNAVIGFAKTLSNEAGKFNVTVNNVAPGYTLTKRLYELSINKSKLTGESHEHTLAEMAKEVPLVRLARPDEIASAVVYLASEQAGYITGNTIQVDGGLYKGVY
ncbi:MAG: SDR family oxidoreductase [Ignavibacteria bacterium]|jgi:3-oxoacyl-[acyl-carrier protein] reductase|nr:SDR family oxidoreductase [Ignavibacteria bacterium]MCU7503984.1 SDR family oxidoreductase [Ignavibacteria bacterium]MCU7515356.1 SDR family oxidoreductase [Ignavibacteria bacterium]